VLPRKKFNFTFRRINTKGEDVVGLENKYELTIETQTGNRVHSANNGSRRLINKPWKKILPANSIVIPGLDMNYSVFHSDVAMEN
jgi:hypothetical protein